VNCIISSVGETEIFPVFSVFPNPVRDVLYLQAEPALPPDAHIFVFDLCGRPVYSGIFENAKKGIGVQNWPKGMYFLEVREKGKKSGLRFVK